MRPATTFDVGSQSSSDVKIAAAATVIISAAATPSAVVSPRKAAASSFCDPDWRCNGATTFQNGLSKCMMLLPFTAACGEHRQVKTGIIASSTHFAIMQNPASRHSRCNAHARTSGLAEAEQAKAHSRRHAHHAPQPRHIAWGGGGEADERRRTPCCARGVPATEVGCFAGSGCS